MTTESAERALPALFQRADSDEDGKLDLVGFTIVLEDLGMVWARHETQDRFEIADTDRDGLISLAELTALLRTYR